MKDLGCCQICDSVRTEHMGEAARPESSQHISQGSVGMQCGVWVPPSHLERIWRGSCAAFLEKALKFDGGMVPSATLGSASACKFLLHSSCCHLKLFFSRPSFFSVTDIYNG